MIDRLVTPIYQTSVHQQAFVGIDQAYTYARSGNPTVSHLEEALAQLESAFSALCFSSGMSAITTLLFTLLKSGDHVICDNEIYGGTARVLNVFAKKYNISISWVNTASGDDIVKSISKNTRLIFCETPANPSLKLIDIKMVADIAKAYQLISVVDNTLLTPVLQRPLDFGIDITLYSTTKYIDGHNATMGGAVVSNHKSLMEELSFYRNCVGTIQTPWNAWLILEGLKTLPLRMAHHSSNAKIVSQYLLEHKNVASVNYPGLMGCENYQLANQQQLGLGGVISFELDMPLQAIFEFLHKLELCIVAGSFGSTTTLISHPATMIDPSNYIDQHDIIIPSEKLIRLSIGLENVQAIIQDLDRALH